MSSASSELCITVSMWRLNSERTRPSHPTLPPHTHTPVRRTVLLRSHSVFEDRLSTKSIGIMGGSRSCTFHVTGDQSRHFLQFPPYRTFSSQAHPLQQGSHLAWRTWKNGKTFSSQGKVQEFLTDWKSRGKSHKILENSDFRQMLFVIFSDI